MPGDLSKLRQQLRRSHDAAGRILKHLLRDQPMTSGSFYLQKRRCGKANCCCVRGQLHTAWVITRSHNGATRTFMVPAQERARLRQLTWEYRRYHRARALLAKRHGQLLALADQLAQIRMVSWPQLPP